MTMADHHAGNGLPDAGDPGAEAALVAVFAAARAAAPEPSAVFLARVLADAEAVQAQRRAPVPSRPARQGRWRGILAALGGWGAAGGLATATLAGLWLGFAGAQGTGAVAGLLAGEDEQIGTLDLIPDFDSFALAALETEG